MRFHVGMSFSLRKIKKFIIPFLLGILAFFGFSKLNIMTVYALSNYDTNYTLTIPEEEVFEDDFTSDNNYIDFVDYITSVQSDYYYYYIMYYHNSSNVVVRLVSRNVENFKSSFVGYAQSSTVSNSNLQFIWFTQANISYKEFTFIKEISSTTSNKSGLSEFMSCYVNNNCPSSSSSSTYWTYSSGSTNNFNILTTSRMNISNSNDIYLNDYLANFTQYIYKTDIEFTFDEINYGANTGSRYFYKNVIINGINLGTNPYILSYYDIYHVEAPGTIKQYEKEFGNIFLGGVSKNDFSNIRIDIDFNYVDFNYVDSISYKYLYYGRKTNDDHYYSYHQLSCVGSLLANATINRDNNYYKVSFLSSGLTCTDDLTDIDNIYVRIYFDYDSSSVTSVDNVSAVSNYGFITIKSSVFSTTNGLYIYERFNNLPSNFSFLLSSNVDRQKAYFESDTKYVVASTVDYISRIDNMYYNPISFGIAMNRMAIIYNLSNYYEGLTNLELFVQPDTIVSYSTNNVYYFYERDGTINYMTVNNKYIVYGDKYSITYYLDVISSYIDNMSDDLYDFSIITQNTYNSLPEEFRLFIFIVFILSCIAFIFKIMSK